MYWNKDADCREERETRLIETWDVLKCIYSRTAGGNRKRLIETWDVLKYTIFLLSDSEIPINRNMRCIEIK